MSEESGYTQCTTWEFSVIPGYGTWAIVNSGDGWVDIKETRMNGQEDGHISFIVSLVDPGVWEVEEKDSVVRHYDVTRLELIAIEAHLGTHGDPTKPPV